jgi:ribosomal protein S18 acetylase RimI-like enzyme
MVSPATSRHDAEICEIAKQSKFTRDFASHRFYRDGIAETYGRNEVGIAVRGKKIVGFVYCKHLKRMPVSVVHFMGVDGNYRGQGIGRALMEWALETTPHGLVQLSCEHSNAAGMKFYPALGYTPIWTGAYGKKVPRPYTRFEKRRLE